MVASTRARRNRAAATLGIVVPIACIGVGLVRAFHSAWVTDDAFISFRYARNLVEGHGLVFNPGEAVEGYTNFLWTVWSALGIAAGLDPVRFTLLCGIVCYAASIGLLAGFHASLRDALAMSSASLPTAALFAALCEDWSLYATGGLETAAFTFLALLGFLLLAGRNAPSPRRLLAAGIVFALASMTRPDGVVFTAVAGLSILVTSPGSRARAGAAFGIGFAALWLPFMLWRLGYYGDWFPNTYYAKSAYLAWYSQGWLYLRLFLSKYWILLATPPLLAVAALELRRDPFLPVWTRQVLLAAGFVVAYTFYVVRVGGDFMFARLLVPTLPFWAVLLELGTLALARRRAAHLASTALVALALLFAPRPIEGREIVRGVADEPRHYSAEAVERTDRRARVLERYFEGLPVSVCFTGSEARLVYQARIPRAIECETGLTDRAIARLELESRGRPGHEKHARLAYLVDERRVDFVLSEYALRIVGAEGHVPQVVVLFDDVPAYLLHWNGELLRELARRGARVPDFPAALDRMIVELERAEPERVARVYADLRRFYLDHADDAARSAAFERLLERKAAGG